MKRLARDTVGGMPGQEQRVLGFRSIMAWPDVLRCGVLRFRMVKEPHGVLAIVAGRFCKGIQQFALPLDRRCLAILRDHAASVMRAGCSRLNPLSTFASLGTLLCEILIRDDRKSSLCRSQESDSSNAF